MKKNTKIYILLFIIAILWGTGFVTSEVALNNNWPVFSVLFQRNILSFIIMFILGFKSKFWKDKKTLKIGIITGLIYFIAYALQLYGQKYTTVSNTSLITSLSIAFVPILYWILFKVRPQIYALIGCFFGLVGAVILSYQPGSTFHIGDILVLASAICFAFHTTYIGKHGDDLNLFGLCAVNFFVMSICSGAGMLITKSSFVGDPIGWAGVLPYALIGGAVGVCGQFYCQRQIESYKVSLVLSLEGLFGAIFSAIFLKEEPTLQVWIGGSIMLVAVFFVQIMEILNIKKIEISK